MKIGCFVILAVFIAVPLIASRYLSGWGTFAVIVAEIGLLAVVVPLLIGVSLRELRTVAAGLFIFPLLLWRLFRHFFVSPLERASAALRGATADVHDVQPTEEPADAPRWPDGTSAGERRYVLVDVTITPAGDDAGDRNYSPAALRLESVGGDSRAEGEAVSVRLVDEAGSESEAVDRLRRRARLRIVFACPPALTGRARFRYYFATFGEVDLPP
jgi:hypothetical protein